MSASLAFACGASEGPDPGATGLVLVRVVEGSNEILRVRLRDGAERSLTSTPEREESWPYWSAAAGALVFQATSGQGSDLVLWSPATGERPLTRTAGRDEHWPSWSPVEDRLAYSFRRGRQGGIAVLDVETGERSVLRDPQPQQSFRPAFSPDGSWLVMQRRGESRGSSLWISAPEGPPRPLVDDHQWFDMKPSFARDGQRVFFSRRPSGGGPRNVMSVSLDGQDLRSHSSLPGTDDHSARASPTRDEIVFVSDRDGPLGVYLAELPDGPARRLSPPDLQAFAPRWSPDGELVVASHTQAGAPQPRLSDPDSLASTRVLVVDRDGQVLLDAPGMMPDWMPEWP